MPDEQPTEDRARPGDDREVRDVFICHASADKEEYVRPLAAALEGPVDYWLDEAEIRWGDSIVQKVTEGLSNSRFVLLCLSGYFVGRSWPEKEMNAALSMESEDGVVRVLPLILSDKEQVRGSYPLLHDKKHVIWTNVREVADQIIERVSVLAGHTSHGDTSLAAAPDSEPGDRFSQALAMLSSGNPEEHKQGVLVLGALHDERAVEPLIEALLHKDAVVRTGAANALALLGDERAVEPLIEAVANTSEEHLPRGLIAPRGVLSRHLSVASGTTAGRTARISAARALGELGDARAVRPLMEQLGDKNEHVRQTACHALGQLGDMRAVPPLMERLKDDSRIVRAEAAEALGGLGDARAVDALVERLGDESMHVREAVADSLVQLGDARAVQPLTENLGDTELRQLVAGALGSMGAQARSALPALRKIADVEESWYARDTVSRAIQEIEAAIEAEGEGETPGENE